MKATLSFPLPLHKNHRILPSSRDEALFRCSVSKEIPSSILEVEREVDNLYEIPEASRDTRPHSRRMLSFLPQPKKSHFIPSSTSNEGQFPRFIWECQCSRHTSRGGQSQVETGEEPRGLAIVRKTWIFPSIQDKAGIPCTDSNGTSRINSQHERWTDTPVANSRKAPGQLHWRPETSFTAGEKSRVLCLNTVET